MPATPFEVIVEEDIYNKKPQTKPSLILPRDGKSFEIHIWFDENVFWINNNWLKDDEVTTVIAARGQRFASAQSFLEHLLTAEDTGSIRRQLIMTFLLEKGFFDD